MSYTFGFEAEFGYGVERLAARMNTLGYCGDDHMHNYTCDCDTCAISHYDSWSGEWDMFHPDVYPLRFKHDSSCGGEAISRVYTSPDEDDVQQLFGTIERESVALDVEPSLSAGFHVHVGRDHLRRQNIGMLTLAMCMWEPALLSISSGRWSTNRGWNATLVNLLNDTLNDVARTYGSANYCLSSIRRMLDDDAMSNTDTRDMFNTLARAHASCDRHSSVAISDRHPTVEFRLWNSTRSAWRMELWCRLSLMLAAPTFANALILGYDPDDSRASNMDAFRDIAATWASANGHASRTIDLLDRQIAYLKSDKPSITAPFTTV